MKSLSEQILNCLSTYGDEDNRLIEELEKIISENGYYACSVIFEVLTQLKLDPNEAKHLWYSVVEHRRDMMDRIGRNIGFRASLCDYLCNVNKTLKNPMVLEIHLFENYLQSYMYDYLTGLYSRGFLETILDRELARCKRHEIELSILFFDIDNFKTVNDTYGHAVGDKCLSGVANIIKNLVRTEDTVVRYGGEEIVVIFPLTNKLQAKNIGERIREQVAKTSFRGREDIFNISVSGGLVSYPIDGIDYDGLMDRADRAVYQAKGAGKNNIFMYSGEKRRNIRVNFETQVKFKPVGFYDKSDIYCAHGRNISTSGLLFESESFFNIGTKLQLKLSLGHSGTQEEVTGITGIVVRNEPNPKGRYDNGISFLNVEKPAKKAIHTYIESRLEHLESQIH